MSIISRDTTLQIIVDTASLGAVNESRLNCTFHAVDCNHGISNIYHIFFPIIFAPFEAPAHSEIDLLGISTRSLKGYEGG